MPVSGLRIASRSALRRSHPFQPQQQNKIARRQTSSNSNPNPSSKPCSSATNARSSTATTAVPVPATIPPQQLSIWHRLGPLTTGVKAFGRAHQKRPYLTQFIGSLVIYFVGDLSAQSISHTDYDPHRTLRALCIGAGSSIPAYRWFLFLSRNFNYASKTLSLTTKVVINQTFFTPVFNTYFFGMQSLLAGDGLEAAWERVKKTVPISVVNSLKLWPAVTAFNFAFLGEQYRSIFSGVVAIGWQTYLSYLNRVAEVEVAEEVITHKVVADKPIAEKVQAEKRVADKRAAEKRVGSDDKMVNRVQELAKA